jgi:hypothetical protein
MNMKNTKTIRILTLLLFCLLLGSFTAYKAGLLDSNLRLQGDRPPEQIDTTIINQQLKKDSIPSKADSARFNPSMLSTSKSLILIDQTIEFPKKDSLKKDSLKTKPKK